MKKFLYEWLINFLGFLMCALFIGGVLGVCLLAVWIVSKGMIVLSVLVLLVLIALLVTIIN